MSLHDAYLRVTPFELAFPGGEAGEGPADPAVPLRELGALAFHAVPFELAGRPTLLVDVPTCRALVGAWEGATERFEPPGPAGYVQLPRHLFWAQGSAGAPPEPVDGFFWTVTRGEVLQLLLAAGLREGRPGLSVIPLPEAPLADAPVWLDAPVREEGRDFATTLPGGDLQGLYSLTTAGEALKLAARLFALLARAPSAARPGGPGPAGATPTPSRLPYRRVVLAGG